MSLADSPFLLACRGLPVDRVPVWFMRQAGRSLPEFRAIREQHGFFDVVRSAELTAEVTLQPVRRYGVDAAILFSDIVVPLLAIGVPVEMRAGVGPVFAEPIRTVADIARIRPMEPDDAPYVTDAVRILRAELGDTPLIGFAGAPFTVASYMIEGGPSREYAKTKAMMFGEPETFHRLLDALADLAASSLRLQIEAGASAVQLFDSWAGTLAPDDYRKHVLPSTRRLFAAIERTGVPRIHFGVGTGQLLPDMATSGAEVVGIDYHLHLDAGRSLVGDRAVQGNLDPAVCLAPWPVVADRVRDVLRRAGGLAGHVFNLGHGVLPETDPDILARVVDLVHSDQFDNTEPIRTEGGTVG